MDTRTSGHTQTRVCVDYPLALASGFLATLAMTTVSYLMLPLLGWSQVDVSFWTARTITADVLAFAILAMMMHLLVGLTYACLFARLFEPRLKLSPSVSGLAYGLALWAFAQAVAVPLLGALAVAPQGANLAASPGWFALRLGIGPAIFSLAAHLAYGLVLSLVYGHQCCTADGRLTRVWTAQAAGAGVRR
jgi:hypothetical protein